MNNDYYITGIGVSQYYYGAERLGLPSEKLLRRCGMQPGVVLQPMKHTRMEDFERFMLELILESGDELFGLHVGEQVMPALYGVFPTVITMAGSARDALCAAVRYQSLVAGNAGSIQFLGEDDKGLNFSGLLAYTNPVVRRHLVESMSIFIYKIICFVLGVSNVPVESVSFEHSAPSSESKAIMDSALGCSIQFGSLENRFRLPRSLLSIKMNEYGDEAMYVAEELAKKQLERQQESQHEINIIRLQVQSIMAKSYPRRDAVADRLGISVRTLDRRLANAGLSWQMLLDGMRSQMSHTLLANPQLSVSEVASRLGFADVRSFQRRFRHWVGKSPSEYRSDLLSRR